MKLYLLVEGDRCEPMIYRSWLEHTFSGIARTEIIDDLRGDGYIIRKGGGYPSCLRRIGDSMLEIADSANVDDFFVCVDAEEVPLADRLDEFTAAVREEADKSRLYERCPRIRVHVIIQNCCIETWLLGHTKMLRRTPQSPRLIEMKAFFDVSLEDPEQMGRPPGYVTKASFHEVYLKEMLAEQGKTYSKTRPGVIVEPNYLDALRHRCATTPHLRSLHRLFTVWGELRLSPPSA